MHGSLITAAPARLYLQTSDVSDLSDRFGIARPISIVAIDADKADSEEVLFF
jgi:hypothetical protein